MGDIVRVLKCKVEILGRAACVLLVTFFTRCIYSEITKVLAVLCSELKQLLKKRQYFYRRTCKILMKSVI